MSLYTAPDTLYAEKSLGAVATSEPLSRLLTHTRLLYYDNYSRQKTR